MKPRNWFKKGKGQSTPPTGTSTPAPTVTTTSPTAASSSNPITTAPRANDGFTFEDVLQNTSTVCDVIRSVGEASELLAPLKAIFGVLKIAADTAVLVQKNGADLQDVIDKLNRHKNLIEDELKELSKPDFSKSKDVQGLLGPLNAYTLNLRDLYDELDVLKRRYEENKRKSRFKSVLKVQSDQDKISGYMLKLEDSFQQFMTSVTKFIARQTILLRQEVAEMKVQMTGQATKDALSQLAYAYARGNQHDACMEGTRQGLLENIARWATSSTPIFALVDQAGTGKSTIAAHMTRQWEKDGLLLARYFFSKPSTVTGKDLASTVAREIAENAPSLRPIIIDGLDKHPNFTGCSLQEQLEWIVFAPLRSLDTTRILVVDALDECSKEDRGVFLKHLLDFISSYPMGTCPLKLFLTCRPEDDLTSRLREHLYTDYINEINFQLRPEQHPSNEADIRLYAIKQLEKFLSHEQIELFVAAAKGLFIWASTACSFLISAFDQTAQFELLVERDMTLDSLYGEIINSALKQARNQQKILTKVLQTICVAREPLTADTMDDILGLRSGVTERVVAVFGSVLSNGNQGKPIHVLHPTFLEYLLNPDLCHLGISREDAEVVIAIGCLEVCGKQLKHDICDIHCPPQYPPPNRDIKNLEILLRERTTLALQYAVINALSHVGYSLHDREAVDALRHFFSRKLLNWIELMSLYEKIYSLIQSVQNLKMQIKENLELSTTILTSEDVDWCTQIQSMVQTFQGPIEESAMQVYLSVLPFEPPQSHIARHYLPQLSQSIPRVIRGTRSSQSQSMVLCGHTRSIYCVTYAPDGHLIASGSRDKTVRLWDSATGAAIAELTGHTDRVMLLEFSPDGKVLASASDDKTVRLWDPNTRAAIALLTGHTDIIRCLAFAPKGKVLASGSDDHTARLWDATTGAAIAVLTAHNGMIKSLAFSPDGEVLAMGSDDGTIRLWNPATSAAIAQLTGHINAVRSLAFSPAGRLLASGSYDKTVRLWSSLISTAVVETGHTDRVICLAFSPDGRMLASGSYDKTVRLWNPLTGAPVAVLAEHTDSVKCLSFSPDGKMLASGSDDKTMRLWNLSTGEPVAVLAEHTDTVTSLAFSPDGRMIASGSYDKTVRLWNSPTSVVVVEMTGHSGLVSCFSSSPDGKMLASGSDDYTVRIWDLSTGQAVGDPLLHEGPVISLQFHPRDGNLFLLVNLLDGSEILWNLSTSPVLRDLGEETLISSPAPTSSLIQHSRFSQWTYIPTTGVSFQLPAYFSATEIYLHEGIAAYGGRDGSVIIIDCTHLV